MIDSYLIITSPDNYENVSIVGIGRVVVWLCHLAAVAAFFVGDDFVGQSIGRLVRVDLDSASASVVEF